jgi:5-methyltetrahydropteroyltriglutamate--homocysteine methyltransferase
MPFNDDHIETSHAGSLPRLPELIAANAARGFEDDGFTLKRSPEFESLLSDAVDGVVRAQRDAGITRVNDGEYGKAMTSAVDYGAWWSYSFQRVGGLSLSDHTIFTEEPIRSEPGALRLSNFTDRRDWNLFREAYSDPKSGISTGRSATKFPSTTSALSYRGHEAIESDIANLTSALTANGIKQGFITALSPGSGARILNEFYPDDQTHIWAWADVLREEYLAITNAGLTVQIDDPSLAESWDQINPEPDVEDYRAYSRLRVEALNYALRGIPEEQVRFHLCWGSWHGPHTTDIEFRHVIDLMLAIRAGTYSFEAGNARHEHEWRIWEDVELPEGKAIAPGVVSHATNVVEHPDLVAERIKRFASLVGRERVVASTDCGLGGRLHPQIAWAKLGTLGDGARRATAELWPAATVL